MLGLKSTKGKPSANPIRPTAIKAGDESLTMPSNLSGSDNDQHKSKSNGDSDVEEEDG